MRAYTRFWLAMLMTAVFAIPQVEAQTLFKPVAVVNDSVITGFDLAQRAQLLSLMAGQSQEADRFRRQALESLVLDRLKIQAGERIGLSATDEVANIGFNLFAEQNNREPFLFRQELNAVGIGNQAINDFVSAETIWSEVVRTRFLSRAEPSEDRIEEELRHNTALFTKRYKLKEIGFNLTGDPDADSQKREHIGSVYTDLQAGADFDQAVQDYSEAPSAENGGDLGWVSAEQFSIDVAQNLNSMNIGQITRPINTGDRIVILQLLERQSGSAASESQATEAERERIRQNLLSEEIGRLADGYLQEIRRDALIEFH